MTSWRPSTRKYPVFEGYMTSLSSVIHVRQFDELLCFAFSNIIVIKEKCLSKHDIPGAELALPEHTYKSLNRILCLSETKKGHLKQN